MRFLLDLLLLNCLLASVYCTQDKNKPLRTKCPETACADPQLDPTTGCYSCENSRCKFRGCVKPGAYGPSWMPDNCTVCFCEEETGRESCSRLDCPLKECFGYPLVHKPNRCCPECDFSSKVSESECGAIPVRTKSMYVALGDESCQRDVVMHGCNREFIVDAEGTWFRCVPVMANMTLSFPDCHHSSHMISHVTYKEVVTCTKRRLDLTEIPMDFDPSPSWDCPLYVDPK